MLKLDNNLLEELGLGTLPEDQKRQMLQHIYETLELRVGTQLANQMTDKQLEEFERFIDAGGDANQAQALQWLETNLPNYKQVVQDVFEALKIEVKGMAPQLLQAASQQASTSQTQPVDSQSAYQPQTTQQQQYQSAPTSQPMQQSVAAPTPQTGFTAAPAQPNPVMPVYGAPQQPVQGQTPVQPPVQDFAQPTPQPQQPFAQPAQPQSVTPSTPAPDPTQWQPPQPQQPDQPQWQPPQPPQQ